MHPYPVSCHYRQIVLAVSFITCCCVNAAAQLSANFVADKTGGCPPLAVSFTNQTTGASASAVYEWNFENGNKSALANPGAIFENEQVYNVTLTVKDGSLTSSKTIQVTVYAAPAVNFTALPVKGCLPVPVSFTATSSGGTGGINSYTWDFGDGDVQQGGSVAQTHIYTVPQTATVSLTVSNNFGCTKTTIRQNLITILPPIEAAFSATQRIFCRITDAVQFTNTSTGPGTLSYLWDFGDGTTSTLATPSHVFNLRGTYTVKLTVNSSEGCSNTSTQDGYINVANFTTDFTVPPVICRNSIAAFTSTSTPNPTTSQWLIDGANAYYYNYNYLNYSFSVGGTHTIELKNTFGTCFDSVSKTIRVNDVPNPQGFIAIKNSNCGAPVLYNFSDTTPGAVKWEWNFSSYNNIQSVIQSPSYTYTSDGGYSASLKVTNAAGCTAVTAKYIPVTRPYVNVIALGNRSTCGPFSLTFSSTSTDSIVNYNWNFGDGTTSALSQPVHLFNNPGNYGITLTYTTASGCNGVVSYGDVSVYAKPVADFTASATTVCGNTPVTFTAVNQGPGVVYNWYFGDNTSNSNSSVLHQYNYDSTYTVRLIVYNQGYCADTITKTNYITVLPPFPRITTVSNTCDGNRGLVTLSQASKKAPGGTWNFGDGSTAPFNIDSPTVSHDYAETGTYRVVLTATNGQCTITDSKSVYVLRKQNPVLTASASNVCTNGSIAVTLNNLQNNPDPNVNSTFFYGIDKAEYNDLVRYGGNIYNSRPYVDWGNNFSGSLSNFEKDKTGLRFITRSYRFNCLDTSNFIPLSVKGSNAGFQVITDNVCFKLPVVLRDTSKTNSKILSWQWNFGDGVSQTFTQGGTVTHLYANPGRFNVTLTIVDSSGCSSNSNSQYRYVDVNGPKAVINASTNNTFITLPVYFYNYTNTYNAYNTQYAWSFGDGTTSVLNSPTHSYPVPGIYTVTLIATNPVTRCADTTSRQVTVKNFAPAFAVNKSFLTAGICPPVLVRLSNNSINYTSVKWDFGDGNTADNINYPAHVYEQPGKYIITLYVYGQGGLKGTYTDSITIKQPSAIISIDKKEGCIGLVTIMSATIKNSPKFTWDLGDGSLIANSDTSIIHQYNVPGIYKPYLLLTDSNGCNTFSSLNDSVKVRPNPLVTITPAAPRICRGQPVVLTASGGATYAWSPATGLSNTQVAATIANPDSTAAYVVTVKDDIGCTNTGNVQVQVVQKNMVKVTADTAVCLGNNVQLNASGANSYKWILNTSGLSSTIIPDPVASPLTTTAFTVTGSDVYNCFSDTANVSVAVLSLPVVSVAAVQEILLGSPVQLISSGSSDVVKWLWAPATYLNCNNCPNPVSTPLAGLTYHLTVTGGNGCTAFDTVSLKLQCQDSRVFIPTAFSPNNDGGNDVFSIKGISIVKHMIIYSRWGKPVYERNNYIASDRSTGWDGNYKGEPLPAGAYTYFAEMECPGGGSFVRKGTVMLVR